MTSSRARVERDRLGRLDHPRRRPSTPARADARPPERVDGLDLLELRAEDVDGALAAVGDRQRVSVDAGGREAPLQRNCGSESRQGSP